MRNEGAAPADRLERLWRQGQRPDPYEFLAELGPCRPALAAEILALDQWLRWQAGIRTPAEDYLSRRPDLAADPELAVQLVYGEFLVREAIGDRPSPEEYLKRFPLFADRLRAQFGLHDALTTSAGEGERKATPCVPRSLFPTFRPTLEPPAQPQSTLLPASALGAATPVLAPADADLLEPPCKLGRYRVLRLLGSGGMGAVYVAEDQQLGRHVALKVPRLQEGADSELLERFYREARIAAHLDHPNLCPVYDFGREGDVHFLTMPLLKGEPLSALLKRKGSLPPRTAARIAHRIALAMEFAHQAGIIHRDLKPANVMVTRRGEPIVMDFGLARRDRFQDPTLTRSGAAIGTPLYTPPEQVWGSPDRGRPSWDIFSLGVILYEMLTGRVPFHGTSVHEVFQRILTTDPESPSRFCPNLDRRLETACLTAMAKDPQARHATMYTFAKALEDTLRPRDARRGQRVAASAEPGRRRLLAGALVVSLLIAAVLGGLAWRVRDRPGTTAPPADLLQPGSEWAGSAHIAPYDKTVDVLLRIDQRHDGDFRGVYETEHGTYAWDIEGTITHGTIHWRFVKLLREAYPVGIVGTATVDGRYQGDRIDATYRDADSSAQLELHLREGSAPGSSLPN